MVEVEETVYEKLLKDANDNRAVLRIARIIAVSIVCLAFLFIFVSKYVDISLETYRAEVRNSVAIMDAKTTVQIREIESEGMTTEQYLKWLAVKNF